MGGKDLNESSAISLNDYTQKVGALLPILMEIFPELRIRTERSRLPALVIDRHQPESTDLLISGQFLHSRISLRREGLGFVPEFGLGQSHGPLGDLSKARRYCYELERILDAGQLALKNLRVVIF